MAIDNLYFRCVSSQVKLRNDVDDDDEEQKILNKSHNSELVKKLTQPKKAKMR